MQISFKDKLSKILDWIHSPTLNWRTASSNDTFYEVKDWDGNNMVGFGLGSGAINHGIYSYKQARWLIYGDATKVYVGGIDMNVFRTNSVSGVFTANSGVTVHGFWYQRWGKIAQFYMNWSRNSTISAGVDGNITNAVIGTFAAGYRPYTVTAGTSYGDNGGPAFYYLDSNGGLQMGAVGGTGASRTIAANTQFQCVMTVFLA